MSRAFLHSLLAGTMALAGPLPPLAAQASANAALVSAVANTPLPEGARLDRGLLNRAAARSSLDGSAKEAGATLGPRHEVYRFGSRREDAPSFQSVRTHFEAQQWRLVLVDSAGDPWGWLDRDSARVMFMFLVGRDGGWLYLAEVTHRAPAVAMAGTAARGTTTPGTATPGTPSAGTTSPGSAAAAAAPNSTRDAPTPAGPHRFSFSTTTFDDGWVATDEGPFVRVVNGPITVLLFLRTAITETMRPPTVRTSDFFWVRDVRSRYDVRSEDRRTQELMFSPVEYLEGEAVDRTTNRSVYVGMLVHRLNGTAVNIVVVAPDKTTFRRDYPTPESLERLLVLNKFAVAPTDLPGTWTENSGAFAQMYYVSSGNYAGMDASARSVEIVIRADGTYSSVEKGAAGMVGSQRFFQDEYRGTWRLEGPWKLVLTNRREGRTESFHAQFEAVPGGRILHLVNERFSGLTYTLGRRP